MKKEILYCTISRNNAIFTITYKYDPIMHASGSCQGYSLEVFKNIPNETPIIIWIDAHMEGYVEKVLSVNPFNKYPPDKNDISLEEYFKRCKECGALIETWVNIK